MSLRKKATVTLEPGTFVRFDRATKLWLKAKAKSDAGRSVSSMVRKIVADAKAAEEFGTRAA